MILLNMLVQQVLVLNPDHSHYNYQDAGQLAKDFWLLCDSGCECVVAYLGLGHVQQTHRVAVTVEESSDCVQGFVELPLDVCHLLKHLAG